MDQCHEQSHRRNMSWLSLAILTKVHSYLKAGNLTIIADSAELI